MNKLAEGRVVPLFLATWYLKINLHKVLELHIYLFKGVKKYIYIYQVHVVIMPP
jgi:hypothetical protein